MATSTHPVPDVKHLRGRLSALRRRLYTVTLLRGAGLVLAVFCLNAAVAGALDWRFHLPAFVRAVILVWTLACAAFCAFRYLYRPLSARTDDLSLALRIEESYPSLNDALATTVQFLDEPDALPPGESVSLRTEAMRRARDKINLCDFNRIVDTRGLWYMTLLRGAAVALVVLLAGVFPALAVTALARLADPFGAHDWPAQTRLTTLVAGPLDGAVALIGDDPVAPAADGPSLRVGRGQVFLVRGKLVRGNKENGIVPRRAVVQVRTESGSSENSCEVVADDDKNGGRFETKFDTTHYPRGFKFRVIANDAVTADYEVIVQQPPVLLPLDGKPSPQLNLDYPAYTGLPSPQALPPGLGDVEAVCGTAVTLRARADRPLRRAWIEYQPDLKFANLSAFLSPLGANDLAGVLALTAAGVTTFDTVPAKLDADRTHASPIRFLPEFSGLSMCCISRTTPVYATAGRSPCACTSTRRRLCSSNGRRRAKMC